jgi:hypothetical protein
MIAQRGKAWGAHAPPRAGFGALAESLSVRLTVW